ncbi:MAG: FAD/NAD(P)-binding protein [Bacteroidales bacterium]|nr:FAD/NAD(P)-binding protein [Bacteroidales bacterium]
MKKQTKEVKGKGLYEVLKAEVDEIIDESPLIKTFVMTPEEPFKFNTGEFIELTLDGLGEAPFTPSSSPFVTEKLEVTIMKTGYITSKFHDLKSGAILGIRGPFGRGYPVDRFIGKEILIVGGGCGLAPIRSLLFTLIEMKDQIEKVVLLYGSKTPTDCIYKPMFAKLNSIDKFETYRSADRPDGTEWDESIGLVTILLDQPMVDMDNSIAVVCGPPVMMKFATLRLLELGFSDDDIFLSMEKNMSCGLGKCGHCMMGEFFVCKDGPVFTYAEIKHSPEIWK